jgi:hypothetical protein
LAPKGKSIVQVPPHLKPLQFSRYPPDNAITFERWYLENWTGADDRERLYLPIQWTALYCNNGYGNPVIVKTIQKFLDTLPTDKKYYTIVQYDDGILNNIEHLDIKVCAMAGPRIDFSLPLLCTQHKFNFQPKEVKKIYKASFIGNYTHSMRATMIQQLEGKDGYYVTTRHHNLSEYCKVIAQSKYVLCPRGYGQSSFRIQEAIDFGAIPIYISDEFIFPYNMPTFPFGLVLKPDADIDEAIKYAEQTNLDELIKMFISANRKLFTYAGCKQEILQHLNNDTQFNNQSNGTTVQ